jgi:ribosomal protein S18 acetylase RimI-like enzyme
MGHDETKRIDVANAFGSVLAYIIAAIKAYPPINVHKHFGYIVEISISEFAWRRGKGKELLDAALEWFQEQGLQ